LEKVVQAEYFFHEAFHATTKFSLGSECPHFPLRNVEEACAFLAGHLAAVNYFKGTNLESESMKFFKSELGLAKNIHQFYKILNDVYTHEPLEKVLETREDIFVRARKVFGSKLGGPINNAFFLYWNHYYGLVPLRYEGYRKAKN